MAYGTTLTGERRQSRSIRVWDPVVRVVHWVLVIAFAVAWFSVGSNVLHDNAGYVVLGLVVFRLLWGIVGTHYARFSDFVPTWRRFANYLRAMARGRAPRHLGHNPAGGVMIVILLATLAVACKQISSLGGKKVKISMIYGSEKQEWLEPLVQEYNEAKHKLGPCAPGSPG